MAEPVTPDVIVNVCQNCIPAGRHLPRQWRQDGIHVVVREVPCSGKIESQYLLHALEGVTHGLCVIACPKGKCHLAEGNYRAEIRIRTVKRLLAEIGIAMLGSEWMPYYRAGNAFGLSVGSRGGAELEALIGEPGEATIAMDSISVSHMLVVFAVILANIGIVAKLGRGDN